MIHNSSNVKLTKDLVTLINSTPLHFLGLKNFICTKDNVLLQLNSKNFNNELRELFPSGVEVLALVK